jgi:hypothetical protein
MKYNVNEYVCVKLTEFGRLQLKHDFLQWSKPFGLKYAPKSEVNGWSQWQLWDLMKSLGKYCKMGTELPFETEIFVGALSDLKEPQNEE